MENHHHVRVGVGVIIVRDGRVLLGERIGSHGAETWALPGGHLRFGESIEGCARREVLEETGVAVNGVRHVAFTNDIFGKERLHYITLFVEAVKWRGRPVVMEPEKCRRWAWFEWDDLPTPIFLPLKNLKHQGYVLPDESR
jgi:8-oxo-dGTP diphosphatase